MRLFKPRWLLVAVIATTMALPGAAVGADSARQGDPGFKLVPYSPPPGITVLSVPGCPDGNACSWSQSDYDGQRDVLGSNYAGQWFSFDEYRRYSAKNRFTNRKFKLGRRTTSSGVTVLTCLDPGDNRPDPGYFDAVYISDATSDRCG